MPSPVTSSDFDTLTFGQRLCDVLTGLLRAGEKMSALLDWLLGPDGELADEVIAVKMRSFVPVGVSFDYRGQTVPEGFLWENGAAVSRTTYAALFAVIGTVHGMGDGSTTFNVPDSRDKVNRGAASAAAVGTSGGADTVALTALENGPHTHTFVLEADGSPNQGQNYAEWEAGRTSPQLPTGGVTASSGSGNPFSIVPSHLKALKIIKY